TEKSTLVSDDLVLIEDSEASSAKKKAKISSVRDGLFAKADANTIDNPPVLEDDGDGNPILTVELHLDSVTHNDVLALTGPSGRVAACLEDGTLRVLDGETPGGIPRGTHSASVMLIPHPYIGKPPKAYFVQEPVGTGTHSAGS